MSKKGYADYIIGKCLKRMEFVPDGMSDTGSLLQDLIKYILQHFREKLTLDDLARHFSYNKYYLSDLLNKNLKCSLTDYVNRLRLEYFRMNYTPDETVESQLYKSGFQSRQTFYRAYKQVYGEKPALTKKWNPFTTQSDK